MKKISSVNYALKPEICI